MKTERKWSKPLLRDGILKDSIEKNQYKLDSEWNGKWGRRKSYDRLLSNEHLLNSELWAGGLGRH